MAEDKGPGTYALLLHFARGRRVLVGRGRRPFVLKAGLHVYVGSALGSGGLDARLRRHAGSPTRLHWHIDYVSRHAERLGALIRSSRRRHECSWARWFGRRADECLEGFGASDCSCRGHLFRLPAGLPLVKVIEDSSVALKAHFLDWRDTR